MSKWMIRLGVPLLVGLLGAAWIAWRMYVKVFGPAVHVPTGQTWLYIPTGAGLTQVCDSLMYNGWLADTSQFAWVARRMDYAGRVKPGRYQISDGMSLRELTGLLRSGAQDPVRLVVKPFRTMPELIAFLDQQLEPDANSLTQALRDPEVLKKAGLTEEQSLLLVIPNTYEVWWNTSASGFAERMVVEYERFWTEEKRLKAADLGLTPMQVGILASIVQEETNKRDEMSRIAGVYLNRLKIGMFLQADPTVKYAMGNPAIRRILFTHLETESPYNTYRYGGLPPGPIAMPETFVLNAVLNAEDHNYLFFCARADLSGYHAFSRTGAEHARYARAYQQALNRQGIK